MDSKMIIYLTLVILLILVEISPKISMGIIAKFALGVVVIGAILHIANKQNMACEIGLALYLADMIFKFHVMNFNKRLGNEPYI